MLFWHTPNIFIASGCYRNRNRWWEWCEECSVLLLFDMACLIIDQQ